MRKRILSITLLIALALTGCNRHTDLKPTIAHEENKTTESMVNAKPVTPTEEPTAAPSTEGKTETQTENATTGNAEQVTTENRTENITVEEPTGEVATENRTEAPTQQPTTSQPTIGTTTSTTQQATTKQPATTQAPTTQQQTTQQPTTQQPTTQAPTVVFDENKAREAVLKAYSDLRMELKGWGPVTLDAKTSSDSYNAAQQWANKADYYRKNNPVYLNSVNELYALGKMYVGSSVDYDAIYDYFYKYLKDDYITNVHIGSRYEAFFYKEITTTGVDVGIDSEGNHYILIDASPVSYDVAVQANYDGVAAYRATLGYQPFEYNEKLMKQAQEWADMLAANPEWYDDNTKVHSSMHEGVQTIPCYETVSLCGGPASYYYSNARGMYTHSAAFKFDDTKGYQMGFGVAVDKNGRSYVVMQMSNSYKLSQ